MRMARGREVRGGSAEDGEGIIGSALDSIRAAPGYGKRRAPGEAESSLEDMLVAATANGTGGRKQEMELPGTKITRIECPLHFTCSSVNIQGS